MYYIPLFYNNTINFFFHKYLDFKDKTKPMVGKSLCHLNKKLHKERKNLSHTTLQLHEIGEHASKVL